LRRHLTTEVKELFFTLFTSAPTALNRAQEDPNPGRVVSRLPEVQANLYAEFDEALPFLREVSVIIEADSSHPEVLAGIMTERILQKT
jgi:hypothetical protein